MAIPPPHKSSNILNFITNVNKLSFKNKIKMLLKFVLDANWNTLLKNPNPIHIMTKVKHII